MGKLKTKKGVAKRFRFTKNKKIKYGACGKSHLLSAKKPRRLRKLRKTTLFTCGKEMKYLKRMLPGS
jgi:large subunit ribosomal protein L35